MIPDFRDEARAAGQEMNRAAAALNVSRYVTHPDQVTVAGVRRELDRRQVSAVYVATHQISPLLNRLPTTAGQPTGPNISPTAAAPFLLHQRAFEIPSCHLIAMNLESASPASFARRPSA